MWAIRQSPYAVPDDLGAVCVAIQDKFVGDEGGLGFKKFADERDLENYISGVVRSIPEYMKWNDRKNGDDRPFNFVSRFDGPGDPDDYFIDLCALERNVTRSISEEEKIFSDEAPLVR